jgi:hypothetical protein
MKGLLRLVGFYVLAGLAVVSARRDGRVDDSDSDWCDVRIDHHLSLAFEIQDNGAWILVPIENFHHHGFIVKTIDDGRAIEVIL